MAPRARSFPGSWPATATPCLARRAASRVLERAQRESGDLRRGRDDRRAAAPDGQPQARRPQNPRGRRTGAASPGRPGARPAGRRVGDARRRRQEAPSSRAGRATTSTRRGRPTGRESRSRRIATAASTSGRCREGGRRAGAAARRPRRRHGRRPGARTGQQVAYSEASGGATSIWILRAGTPETTRVTRSRRRTCARTGRPTGAAWPSSAPIAADRASGSSGPRRHRPARRRNRGRRRPGLGERGAGARARPAGAPARPRPACAGGPRRDRQRGRVLPRIHLRGGQPRSGSAPDPRAGGRAGWPRCAPTR